MLVNKIVSTFGDHTSLIPMLVKDTANSIGMTAFSYDAGGENEGKDRFIDEFGTMAIWLGGLPFFKKLIDKTAYKAFKLNPDIDIRLISDKTQFKAAQEYAQRLSNKPDILETLNTAANKSKTFKGMFIGKFAAATALSLATFLVLTNARQKYINKKYENDYEQKLKEQTKNTKHKSLNFASRSAVFKGFMNDNFSAENYAIGQKHNPSFKGLSSIIKTAKDTMFDPVKNLFLMDLGIATERVKTSRTKTEKGEYLIKESATIAFLYLLGKYVQKGIELFSNKALNKPIELHANVLSSNIVKNHIKNGNLLEDANKFLDIAAQRDNKQLFEYIYNSDNLVVKTAKKADIIKTISKDLPENRTVWKKITDTFKYGISGKPSTGKIDPHQYINPKTMVKHAENLRKIAENAPTDAKKLDKYMKSLTNMKRGSVAANIGISCLFLGVMVPLLMREYRKRTNNGSKESTVQREIEQKIENNFKAKLQQA